MIGFILSLVLPRRCLQSALLHQWRRTLSPQERVRFDYFGATGNIAHHEFAWADSIPQRAPKAKGGAA